MEYFEKIEREFYYSKHGYKKTDNTIKLWNNIKQNRELLKWAIKLKKDKSGKKDTVNGVSICETILLRYNSVDSDIYQELIDLIYSNTDIARIVQNGYSNYRNSFLLMTLWNSNLKLSENKKAFAVNEAMNMPGTINDNYSSNIVHGNSEFDIRYEILKNSNWSIDEKKDLIMEFWADDEVYKETLEQWENSIIDDISNYIEDNNICLEMSNIYKLSYDELLELFKDKKITNRINEEINFCRLMHELRPIKHEKEYNLSHKV